MRFIFYLCVIFLTIFLSCNDIEDCQLNPYTDQFVVRMTSKSVGIIFFDSISVNNSGRIPNDTDTLILFSLPLDAESMTSLFTFYTDSTNYTLEVNYRTQAEIFELNCDAAIRFYGFELISNFESVRLISPELNMDYFPINAEILF